MPSKINPLGDVGNRSQAGDANQPIDAPASLGTRACAHAIWYKIATPRLALQSRAPRVKFRSARPPSAAIAQTHRGVEIELHQARPHLVGRGSSLDPLEIDIPSPRRGGPPSLDWCHLLRDEPPPEHHPLHQSPSAIPHAALPEGPVAGRANPVLLGGANNLAVHAKSGGDALSRPAPRRETRLTGNSSLALM